MRRPCCRPSGGTSALPGKGDVMWNLNRSRTLDKLRRGETVLSFKSNLSCPRAVEIAALAGFDCVWLCCEHVPNDWLTLERQVLAGRAGGADIMVRVERGSYSDLIKPLELNASGILVPHVISAEEARQIVRHTRFYPLGRRPADGGNSDGCFTMLPFAEYIRFANENRFVMIQVEDSEALAELDEICAVPGIDAVFFGPGDFSQSIGVPGEIGHPEVKQARKLVAAAARRHGKFAATVGGTANLGELWSEGYRFINLTADVVTLAEQCRRVVENAAEVLHEYDPATAG